MGGAQWLPATVYDDDRVTPAFLLQFAEAARFSYRRYQLMVSEYYGILWSPNYMMSHQRLSDGGLIAKQSPMADLMPELRDLAPGEHPFPFPYVRQFDTMFVQPSIYLESMVREFRIAGGTILVHEMPHPPHLLPPPHPPLLHPPRLSPNT